MTSVADPEQIPCLDTTTTIGITTLASTSEHVTSQCLCTCPTTSNISTEDLQQKITQMKENLTVAKASLSSSQRKLISAPDERQSSVTMGILGTCVIIGTLFALIGSDLFKVFFITVKFLKKDRKWKSPMNYRYIYYLRWHWTIWRKNVYFYI